MPYKPHLKIENIISSIHYDAIQKRIDKLSFPEPNSGCFIWQGATTIGGYGIMTISKKVLSAHRVSYFLNKGIIEEGLQIDHLCNNTYCVNPLHLDPKTPKDNSMRGNSPIAKNARKTHCSKNHKYTDETMFIDKNGFRNCRICLKIRAKKTYDNNRESILKQKKKYHTEKREMLLKKMKDYQNRNKIVK